MQKVLVAVDNSDYSKQVLKAAAKLAEKFGSKIILLNVVPKIGHMTKIEKHVFRELQEELENEGKSVIDGAIDSLDSSSIDCKTMVKIGDASEEILKTADEEEVDLIVTGSHGKSGIARFLLGSVSQKVANHANCSVLIIR